MAVVTSAEALPAQQAPPPQVGFNNNVKHRGRVFHIQTEDSGVNRPHLTTHLFVDGGRIIRSTRTDYAELLGQKELPALVRKRMKEQHKAMFVALRRGQLDELIEAALAPQDVVKAAPETEEASGTPSASPRARRSRPPVTFTRPRAPSLLGIKEPSAAPPPPQMKSTPPSLPSVARTRDEKTTPRPALHQSGDASSLYGDGKIGEKSLDDVILSYISEDLTPSDKA
jgi:hypothetical protein